MKYRALIITAFAPLLFIGCTKSQSDPQIISAVYGESTNFTDVSIRVRDLVHQTGGFNAQPTWLQADPMPGWNKVVVIIYEVKGRRHTFAAPEGASISANILLEASRQ
jgi:hypothetical protein